MLRNYLTIAYRNLRRHKGFSLINISGLAIGMAVCLLILQYVRFERSYDAFHTYPEQIYRIGFKSYSNDGLESRSAKTYPALGSVMRQDFPEISSLTRMVILGESIVTHEQINIRETNIYLTDTSFFHVFSFPMRQGDAQTALAKPFTVLISQSMAGKLFGESNPLDKPITLHSNNLDGAATFLIKGVFDDIPANSHLKPQILISYPTLHEFIGRQVDESWQWNNLYTYVRLHPAADVARVNAYLATIAETYNGKKLQEAGARWEFFLQPLTAIHLYSDLLHEPEANGNAQAVYFLAGVALLVLVIAVINFIGLATAQSARRAKEVGIRKAAGAFRFQLIVQFIAESCLLNLLAFLLAITLVQLCAAYFTELTGIPADFFTWSDPLFLLLLVSVFLVTSVSAGAYPAFALSAFSPVKALKGETPSDSRGVWLRKGLVIGQFAVSMVLVAGTLTSYRQLTFMRSRDLGINVQQTLVARAPKATDANGTNWEVFKRELSQYSGKIQLAAADEIPGKEIYWRDATISLPNEKPVATFTGALVDASFFEVLAIDLLAGRMFNSGLDSRERSVMLNETATRVLGFSKPEDALWQKIRIRNQTLDIVGIVADFHQQSLKSAVEPMVFRYASDGYGFNYYLIKMQPSGGHSTPEVIKAAYDRAYPNNAFEYFFLDEYFDAQYQADRRFTKLFSVFSGLAVFVACLGLSGLSAFTASRRTKEIGVRKVLGASVWNILTLLNKDLITLILLSNLLAWPLAWWGIQEWLNNYAYAIEMKLWLFIVPALLILLIALITASLQTLKAARTNPVNSLRSE